jgi:PAS domain-containing protein
MVPADTPPPRRPAEPSSADPSVRLLSVVTQVQAEFIQGADPRALFGALLKHLLSLTRSDYGFVAEVLRDADGAPYLKTHALTNIAWDDETRALFARHEAQGLEFRNLKTLFGAALVSGRPVIANDVAHDPRSGGRPIGHPALERFLGVPQLRGGEMVGMVGLANRPGGYDEALLTYLEPLLATCTSIVQGVRIDRQRRAAETDLRAANARLSALLSNAEAGVLLESEDRRIVLTNRRFCELFRVPVEPEAMVGADCSRAAETSKELFAEPDAFVARIDAILARREPVHAETVRAADGRVLERDYVPIHVEGVYRGHYWQYRDVTARERAAEELRRREVESARLRWSRRAPATAS